MELLRIAIQKSGRLSEKSLSLFSECGIGVDNGDRKLVSRSWNYPLQLLFLRDDDIPQYVADGVADAGIAGENILAEKGIPLEIVEKLGFGRCRVSLAIPKTEAYNSPQWLNGKRVATSYPRILQNYLDSHKLQAEIHEISGSVEIAPGIGLADAILDIVSSGSTLISNGLAEVETIMKSEAVLFRGPATTPSRLKILENLLFRIRAVQMANTNRYILLNAPNSSIEKITSVIPGMKSPTIMPLAREGWSSIHSVVTEHDFWEVIGKLKELGAEGILVIPIEKMIL